MNPPHVHSFGPKGRMTCACGMAPEEVAFTSPVRQAADVIEAALLPLTGNERKAAIKLVTQRGVMP